MLKIRLLILFLLFVFGLNAQIRIEGEVKDLYNQPVVGATIFLEGTFFETDTDSKGNYMLIVDEGTYGDFTLVGEKKGYDATFKGITLKKGVTRKIENLLFENKINELTNVVIFEDKAINKVEVVAAADISELDVLVNASDANIITSLNSVSGAQQVGETGELSVRGGAGNETNYYFDGMILRDQLGASVQNQGSSFRFSPSMFQNMELSSGGFSAEYGQALSSILVMTSKDVLKENSLNIFVSPFFVDVKSSWNIKEKQSLETNINVSDFGLYTNLVTPDLPYLRLDKGPRMLSGNVFYKYKINEKSMFKAFSYMSSAKITSIQDNINNPSTEERSKIQNLNSYNLVSFQHDFNKKSNLQIGFSYGYNNDKIQTDTINNIIIATGNSLERTAKNIHTKAAFKTELSTSLSMNTGVEFFNQKTNFASGSTDIDVTDNLLATYWEGTLKLFKNMYTFAGIRYEYSDLTKKNNVAPRLNVTYLNDNAQLRINAAYGNFYQQARANYLLENPRLEQLKATHQILSLEKKFKNQVYKLEVFNKDYKRLIRETDEGVSTSGKGFARGFDILTRGRKIFNRYSYRLTYSYLDTERLFRDYPIQAPITFASKHKASLNINRSFFKEDFIIGVTYSYNSGRPYFNPNNTVEAYNENTTNAYHNLSANLIYSFKIKNTPVLLISTISNILGNEQTFGYEYSDVNFSVRRPIQPLYNRFIFVGCYITLGFDKSDEFIDDILNN